MKIYTRTGDAGDTALFGGGRVGKDHLRVRAYGDVDEANAAIGMARALAGSEHGDVSAMLERIQDQLFTIGAELASPHGTKARSAVPPIDPTWILDLERAIDRMNDELPPLTQFVLPGGSAFAAALHVARCVCRRAEREVVALAHDLRFSVGGASGCDVTRAEGDAQADLDPSLLPYLNRLSDYLFVAARLANRRSGTEETIWKSPRRA